MTTPNGSVTTPGYFFVAPPGKTVAQIGVTAVATIGGPAVTTTTTVADTDALVVFDGQAGQTVSFTFSNVTYGNDVRIYNPDGTTFRNYQGTGNGTFFDAMTLAQTGTYTILVDGQGSATGSHTVRVYEVPPDATAVATIGGPAVTTTTRRSRARTPGSPLTAPPASW